MWSRREKSAVIAKHVGNLPGAFPVQVVQKSCFGESRSRARFRKGIPHIHIAVKRLRAQFGIKDHTDP